MYAIVKTGGKQYRVERGQRLLVERLPEQEGASVALAPLMYRSEEAVFDSKGLEQVRVTARILARPALCISIEVASSLNSTSTWPPIRSLMAGAVPRYGT